MSLSRFRLITFGVTNTLIQFRTSPGKQFGEIGEMLGILCDNETIGANYKANWHKMNRAHPNFGLKTKIGWENWWRQLIIGTFHDNGVKIPDENKTKISDHIIEVFKTSMCWQHCYGSIEFLNYLKLQQQIGIRDGSSHLPPFRLGVISNFDPRLDILLRNMKLNHYFDFVINSYDAGCEKPSKEIFEKAMRASEMKNLKPKECLHIGDTPVTDYFGARSAGWYGALIHEKDPEFLKRKYGDEQIEDHQVFRSLFDLHKKMSNDYINW